MNSMDRGGERRKYRFRRLRGARDHNEVGAWILIERMILSGPNLRVECTVLDVIHHANYCPERLRCQSGVTDPLSNRVFTAKICLCESPIDDDDLGLRLVLGIGKIAASQEFRPDCLEELRTDIALVHFNVFAVVRPPYKANPSGVPVLADRDDGGQGGGLNSGN